MKYKVGDRVKLNSKTFPSCKDKVYTVIMANPNYAYYPYRVKENSSGWNCLMYERELEFLVRIGQLHFMFD